MDSFGVGVGQLMSTTPVNTKSTTETTSEISSEVPHPIRLEKKTNIVQAQLPKSGA